jgi:PEGA domain
MRHLCLPILGLLIFLGARAQDVSTGVNAPVATSKATASPPASSTTEKARVFITDSESWEMSSSSGGSASWNQSGGTAWHAGQSHGGARPQTAEIIKTFGERCPQVTPNNKQDFADYIVVLDHEGGKGLLRHKNKVAVFERISGDSIVSKSTVSLGGSVQDACEAINQHWAVHGAELRAAVKETSTIPGDLGASAATSSASVQPSAPSQAMLEISSTPPGADIELDGSFVGSTPSSLGVSPGDHSIKLSKNGYATWERKLKTSTGTVKVSPELEPIAATPAK